MGKKKIYANINVKEIGLLDLKEKVEKRNSLPIEERIGLVVQLDEMIANLKIISDNLALDIANTDYDKIMKDFRDRGLLTTEDDIIIHAGGKIDVTLSKKDEKEVVISAAMKDVASALPEKYKETKISINKKAIANDYLMGKLEKILAPYVSLIEVKETKMKRTKVEPKK